MPAEAFESHYLEMHPRPMSSYREVPLPPADYTRPIYPIAQFMIYKYQSFELLDVTDIQHSYGLTPSELRLHAARVFNLVLMRPPVSMYHSFGHSLNSSA